MQCPPRVAVALFACLLGGQPVRAALDVPQLRAHAAGRQLALAGDVAGAQEAWDGILAGSGPIVALVVSTPCGADELSASIMARRALSPLWICGGEAGNCHLVAWGAFRDEAEAASQAEILAPGMLPMPLRVVTLQRPLAHLGVEDSAPVSATASEGARESAERRAVVVTPSAPEPEPRKVEPLPREVEDVEVTEVAPEYEPAAAPAALPTEEVVATPPEAARSEPEVEAPHLPVFHSKEPEAQEPPPPSRAPEPQLREPERPPETTATGESAELLFARGNVAYASGDYETAIRAFEEAIELEPGNPRSWNNLGTTYLLKGDAAKAEVAFRKAIALDPGYGRAQLNLGSAFYALNKPVEARAALEAAVALDPSNVDAHYSLAALLADLRLFAEAAAALRRGLELNPGNAVLEGYLRDVDKEARAQGVPLDATPPPQGDAQAPVPDRAPAAPRQAPSRRRASPCDENLSRQQRSLAASRHFNDGKDAYDRSAWRSAEAAFEDALACDPTSVPILNYLGAARMRAGDAEGAADALDLATTLDPASLDAGVNLALALYQQGRCDDALAQLAALERARPGTSEVKFHEGRLLYKCGRVTEATAALQEAERRDPSDDRARRLLEELSQRTVSPP